MLGDPRGSRTFERDATKTFYSSQHRAWRVKPACGRKGDGSSRIEPHGTHAQPDKSPDQLWHLCRHDSSLAVTSTETAALSRVALAPSMNILAVAQPEGGDASSSHQQLEIYRPAWTSDGGNLKKILNASPQNKIQNPRS